jgi:hypothetical protein
MPLLHRDEALAEVVGFVLLLGVMVLALAMYQLYVVPADGREDEIQHMNEVKNRFVDYKMSLDSLWTNDQSGMTLSTSFELGTEGGHATGGDFAFPLMKPIGSTATLSLNDPGHKDYLRLNSSVLSEAGSFVEFPMGRLAYVADNNYWIRQTYYYQMGGVFLSQDGGTTTRVSPSVSIYNRGNTSASVLLAAIRLRGAGSVGGSTPVRVDSRLMEMPSYTTGDAQTEWVELAVNTTDKGNAEVWHKIFVDAAQRGNLPTDWYESGVTDEVPWKRAYIRIDGPKKEDATLDVEFGVTRADYAVILQKVAAPVE